jgi:thiamine pyrophosphokinase
MSNVVEIGRSNPLVGTWRSCEGFSDVHVTIDFANGSYLVSAVDTHDGEHAEVHDVKWSHEESTLYFSTYWASSGQFTKYRVQVAPSSGRVSVTYTFTGSDTWEKA